MTRTSTFVRSFCVLALSTAFAVSAHGQLSISGTSTVTVNFNGTVAGVSNGAFTGAGFSSSPTAGQLDSDAWAVTGWSDGDLAYGGTRTTAATDYTRGASAVAVTTGGIYAATGSPNSAANPALMVQPGGSDFAPGTITLRVKNNSTRNMTAVQVAYTILVRNDQPRSSTFNLQYSTDDAMYQSVFSLGFTTPAAADALGWTSYGSRGQLITGLSVPPGSFLYLRWFSTDVAGTGSRDEIGLDDIAITPTLAPATFTVTKTDDTNDGTCDADCSLREAIAAAISGDTVVFSPLFSSPQTITLNGSELQVFSKNITITGPGANLLTVDGGAGANRVITFNSSTATLSGMKLTGGDGMFGVGGAVGVFGGSVTLDGLYITGNATTNTSGGVYFESASGSVIRNSTISGNQAASRCGGVSVFASGTVSLDTSTISGNTAGSGNGGGVCAENSSLLRLLNTTVTNNTASVGGGGVYTDSSSGMQFGGNIIAGNTAPSQPEILWDSTANVSSAGFNLVGDAAGDSPFLGSYLPTDIRDTDPQLGPLANNGGPTPTHGLALASPAVDQGNSFGTTADQRGFARTFDNPAITNAAGGDGTDIGAYERLTPTAANVSVAGRITDPFGRGVKGVTVTIQRLDNGETRTALSGPFGYYSFDEVVVSQVYVVSVRARRNTFAEPARVLTPTDSLADVDFQTEQ